MTKALLLLLAVSLSCTQSNPRPTPQAARASATEPGRSTSVRILSVVGHPNGSGNRWQLAPDQDRIELEITLEGKGRFDVRAELESLDGDVHREFDETIELDGEERIRVEDFLIPVQGSYRLMVKVAGDGVRSQQRISVQRG